MGVVTINCPTCESRLEFFTDSINVICTNCGTAYLVREHKGAISLSKGTGSANSSAPIEEELNELDEYISDLNSEIESIRSKEQGIPLQVGCAIFGIFSLAILVVTAFATFAINYFAKWPFYLSLVVVLILGVFRVRRKLANREDHDRLRSIRESLEEELTALELERERLRSFRGLPYSKDEDSIDKTT